MIGYRNIFWCLVLFFLLCGTQIVAQPGGCSVVFPPTSACQVYYLTEDFVFVGKVSARTGKTIRVGNYQLWEISIAKVIQIKGKVPKTTGLFLDLTRCSGSVEIDKKYIFTARRLKMAKFDELVSSRWSTDLDDFSDDDLAQTVKRLRVVANRKKQPSVTGRVFQYNINQLGDYDFKGNSLMTILGYNPDYAAPGAGIKVFAKNGQGRITETVTDKNGEFEFANLEKGSHEISPVLTSKDSIKAFKYYDSIYGEDGFRRLEYERFSFYVTNEFCSQDIRFNVRTFR